ncbi:protein kinase [Verrucomicrobium sp. BvORR106]|uniref:protein kinase domain-containing protein n=1 Tax=Verrucomicrobium sp. BvORR106 TaxID=1403819 RepID=UPI00068B327A|nr:protein kinase [Verrucomicrobium sp. BvORR106]
MNPHEDTLNLGATIPRTPTEVAAEAPSAELELLNTIKIPGSGTLVFNRYRLQRVLGRGGMGVVWLADDTKLDRHVALKFLPDVIGADPVALKELKDETRRGLDLAHPNIVRIYDFVDDDEAAAISMEYVNGKSLSEMRLSQHQHVFSVDDLAPWLAQMCDALDYAHLQRRLVHRDLKPANLMVNIESQVKITDFGIARSVSDTMSRLSMMRANTSGTLLYMSPQQAMGDRPKPTDDIYSVGATLYELLSGKPPFYSGDISMQITAKNAPSVRQRREELEIQATEDIPREWEDAIAACLNKDPAKRPQSAGELARRLGLPARTDAVMTGVRVKTDGPRSIQVRQDRLPAATNSELTTQRRSWVPLASTLVLLLGASGAAGAWWWMNRPGQLTLESDPAGAIVSIDGQTQKTPAVFAELKPGHYTAKIAAPGFDPKEVEVDLSPGQKKSSGLVKLNQASGTLLLSSDPDGVRYEVQVADNESAPKLQGETPMSLTLPVGRYNVTMDHAGGKRIKTLEVFHNQKIQQSFSFEKDDAQAPVVIANVPDFTQNQAARPNHPPPVSRPDTPSVGTTPTAAAPSHQSAATPNVASQPPAARPSVDPADHPPGATHSSPSGGTTNPGTTAPVVSAPATAAPASPAPGATASTATPPPLQDLTSSGSVAPQAPGSVAAPGSGTAMPTPVLSSPLAHGTQPASPLATTPPPDGYWNIDQIFTGSSFNAYSKNGRAYLLFEAQAALKQKSHYKAPVDGKVGQGTHKAIVSFQSANGLQPTGQLDSPTVAALGLSGMEDNSDWSAPARKRSSRSSSGGQSSDGDDDEPNWWRTNVADPFKRAFRR